MVDKKTFKVQLQGEYVESWSIEADSEEEAIERVRGGDGAFLDNEWVGKPQASVTGG